MNYIFFTFFSAIIIYSPFLNAQEKCSIFDDNSNETISIIDKNNVKNFIDSLSLNGYYTLQIKEYKTTKDSCSIVLDIGKKYKTSTSYIIIDKKNNKTHKRAFTNNINETIKNLKDSLVAFGKPFAKIDIKPVKYNSDSSLTHILLDDSELRSINEVKIRGYDKFPKYLKNKLSSDIQFFHPKITKEKISEILPNNFIRIQDLPKATFTKDSTILYIQLQKVKRNYFDGIIGFEKNENDKFKIRGNIKVDLHNAFNHLEKISLNWQSGINDSQDFDFNYNIPYLLNSPFGALGKLNILKQDSSLIKLNLKQGFSYNISRDNTLKAFWDYISANSLGENTENLDFSKSGFGFGYNFSNKIGIDFLQNYSIIDFSSTFFKLKGNDGNNQISLTNQIQRKQKILGSHYVFIGTNGEHLFQKEDVKLNDFFLIGGYKNLRGFNQNSINTASYQVGTFAYQFVPNNAISFELFTDQALVLSQKNKQYEYFYSLGTNVEFLTSFGVFKIGYAFGQDSNNKPLGFSDGKVHIGIHNYF